MITVLFVTTLHNAVRNYLEQAQDISLHTVECSENYDTVGARLEKAAGECSPDLIITYRCPYIIPRRIYSLAAKGAYNIHPSLLPAYAGLNPWDEIFKKKETVGGVTLHRINDRIDGGEIIFQKAFPINPDCTIETARHEADIVAAELTARLCSLYSSLQRHNADIYNGHNK